jgi:hypothetical protein
MKGDVEMILKYASLWALRFLAEIDGEQLYCRQSSLLLTVIAQPHRETIHTSAAPHLDRISLYWPPPFLDLHPSGSQVNVLCVNCHRPQCYFVNPSATSTDFPTARSDGPRLRSWLELLRHVYGPAAHAASSLRVAKVLIAKMNSSKPHNFPVQISRIQMEDIPLSSIDFHCRFCITVE